MILGLQCTGKIERKYVCFYCTRMTTQAPVFTRLSDAGSERLYPSCCFKCADDNLWRDIDIASAPADIVAQAREVPACPLAETTDHACSVRSALIQASYDVISNHQRSESS